MHIAHRVEQRRHLLLARANNRSICVARCRNTERCREIEILFSFRVPDVNAFGAFPHDRPRAVRFGEQHVARFVVAEQGERLAGVHEILTADKHGWIRMKDF